MRTTIKDSSGVGVCLFHVLSNVSTTKINLRGKSDARTKQIQCLGPRCVWFFFFSFFLWVQRFQRKQFATVHLNFYTPCFF